MDFTPFGQAGNQTPAAGTSSPKPAFAIPSPSAAPAAAPTMSATGGVQAPIAEIKPLPSTPMKPPAAMAPPQSMMPTVQGGGKLANFMSQSVGSAVDMNDPWARDSYNFWNNTKVGDKINWAGGTLETLAPTDSGLWQARYIDPEGNTEILNPGDTRQDLERSNRFIADLYRRTYDGQQAGSTQPAPSQPSAPSNSGWVAPSNQVAIGNMNRAPQQQQMPFDMSQIAAFIQQFMGGNRGPATASQPAALTQEQMQKALDQQGAKTVQPVQSQPVAAPASDAYATNRRMRISDLIRQGASAQLAKPALE